MGNFKLPNIGNLSEQFRQQLRKQIFLIRVVQVLVNVILPITEGISINIATSNLNSIPLWTFVVILVVIHFFLVVALFGVEYPLPVFLTEFDDLKNELEITKNELNEFERYNLVLKQSIQVSELNLVSISQSSKSQIDLWNEILEPWIEFRQDIFWFEREEDLYNFAIYILDPKSNMLKVSSRFCHPKLQRKNREWRTGEGHIGICFSTRKTQFSNNASENNNTREENSRAEDAEYYLSLIAHPIGSGDDVVGVFTITSSIPNQFDKNIHVSIVKLIAGLLNTAKISLVT